MEVEVVRSERRRKTVDARLVDGRIRVSIPASLTSQEEAHWVGLMQERLERKLHSAKIDLPERARALAESLHLPHPTEVVFSHRQRRRWGSCTPNSSRIRISSELAAYPRWVVDYVLVHELAHLAEPNHTPAFWELVDRYPLAERARGYLMAKSDGR